MPEQHIKQDPDVALGVAIASVNTLNKKPIDSIKVENEVNLDDDITSPSLKGEPSSENDTKWQSSTPKQGRGDEETPWVHSSYQVDGNNTLRDETAAHKVLSDDRSLMVATIQNDHSAKEQSSAISSSNDELSSCEEGRCSELKDKLAKLRGQKSALSSKIIVARRAEKILRQKTDDKATEVERQNYRVEDLGEVKRELTRKYQDARAVRDGLLRGKTDMENELRESQDLKLEDERTMESLKHEIFHAEERLQKAMKLEKCKAPY